MLCSAAQASRPIFCWNVTSIAGCVNVTDTFVSVSLLFVCIWIYLWKGKENHQIRKEALRLVEVVFDSCKSSKTGEQTHLIDKLWYNERWAHMTAVICWWRLSGYMTGSNNRYVLTNVETKMCLDLIQISKNITNPNMDINLPSCQGDFLFWVQCATSISSTF